LSFALVILTYLIIDVPAKTESPYGALLFYSSRV
jgi:hypothetical protein